MARNRRPQGGRPRGIEIRNREQLRYDLALLGDRVEIGTRVDQAGADDERRAARKYPYLPRAATIWEWLDKGKPVAWPGYALRDLAQFIRDQTGRLCDRDAWIHPPPTAFHVCNAPRRPSLAFRGREAEIEALTAWLRAGESSSTCATVEGLPGIGKTELALQVAYTLAAESVAADLEPTFPRGIFWLNAENPDLTAEWDEIARNVLDIQRDTVEERVAEAIRKIQGSPQRSLLILDNVFLGKDDRWERGRGKPRPLPEGPQISVLVTTQNDHLGGSSCRHWRLAILPPQASRELLLDVSERDPSRDQDRLVGLSELLDALRGHALALEISAVYLQKNENETPRSLLARIRRGDRLERHARQTAYAVQKFDSEATTHGAFLALWESLDADTQGLWRLAAEFEPVPASVGLSAATGLDTDELAALREFHLIEWDARRTRWLMHRLTRSFAREAATPEQAQRARQCFARGCAQHAEEAVQHGGFSIYHADREQFAAARALAPEVLAPELELGLLLSIGPALTAQTGYASADARALYERAWQLAEHRSEPEPSFRAIEGLWQSCFGQGDRETAARLAQRLEALAEVHPSSPHAITAYRVVGGTFFYAGRPAEARVWLEKGISLYSGLEHPPRGTVLHPGVYLHGLAALASCIAGSPEEGLHFGIRAIDLASETGDPPTLGVALIYRAMLHHYRREGAAVARLALQAVELGVAHDLPIFQHTGSLLAGSARIAANPRAHAHELDRMLESFEALLHLNVWSFRPFYGALIAEAHRACGQREEGLTVVDQAIHVVARTGEQMIESDLWCLRAALSTSYADAIRDLERALEIALHQQARWFALRASTQLFELARLPETRARAQTLLQEQIAAFSEGLELFDLQRARTALRAVEK